MTIETIKSGTELTLALSGRLDTTTAPQLEAVVHGGLEGIVSFVLDFSALEYISSAGLRVLLQAQKIMNRQGSMTVRHVCPDVMEVFEVTGFRDMLKIE